MTDLTHAPGCFGAASVYDSEGKVCGACPFANACADQARQTLERIKTRINVDDLLKKHERARPTPVEPVVAQVMVAPVQAAAAAPVVQNPVAPVRVEPQAPAPVVPVTLDDAAILARLPVKPREIADRLLRAGRMNQIRKDTLAGRNAFATAKPEFMRVALDVLLAGACSRSVLRERFQTQLGWTEGTASSHVGICTSILLAFGIARETSGILEVNK